MAASPFTVGFVYVMTNELMPGIVKVGHTSLLPEDRAADLYTTGVPQPFEVAYRSATSRPEAVERTVHKYLHAHRINRGREFFRVPVQEAIEAVRLAAIEAAGIDSWKSSDRHHLRSENRLALPLEAGQMFALVAFRSAMAERAEPIDLWQAHSDGDLLEILVIESASHVAGFSDGDPSCTEDPVPYLNRAKTVVNGMVNGRERLVPGDRLVWLPAQQDAESQASVIFEARDYCQVVSRTAGRLAAIAQHAHIQGSVCGRQQFDRFARYSLSPCHVVGLLERTAIRPGRTSGSHYHHPNTGCHNLRQGLESRGDPLVRESQTVTSFPARSRFDLPAQRDQRSPRSTKDAIDSPTIKWSTTFTPTTASADVSRKVTASSRESSQPRRLTNVALI